MTNTTAMLTVRNMHDSKNEAITFLFPSQSGWIRCSMKMVPFKLLGWGVLYNQDKMVGMWYLLNFWRGGVFTIQSKMAGITWYAHLCACVNGGAERGREGKEKTEEAIVIATKNWGGTEEEISWKSWIKKVETYIPSD